MITSCTCCFTDFIVKCNEVIQVNAKLPEVNSEYMWVITDKFNAQYSGNITTNDNGFFEIPVADLPAGFFTEFSGNFTLQVFLNEESCSPEKFLIAQHADCINFTVHAGTREKNNLGCEF